MNKRIIFALAGLTLCLSLQAQSWNSIKSNSAQYLWAEGFGDTIEEADEDALASLVGKISLVVEHNFEQTEEETSRNGNITSESKVVSKVKTYSTATLTNTERILISNEPNACVGRYILRSDLNRIFEGRITKVKEYAMYAQKAERESCKIDDALRFYYWALILLQSVPNSSTVKYTDLDGNEVLLSTWLPLQIDDIFDNLEARFVRKLGYDAELSFKYKGKDVTSLDYTCFDGRALSNLYSAKDGLGIIELPSDIEVPSVQIRYEYAYRSQAHIDKDVQAVFGSCKARSFPGYCTNVELSLTRKEIRAQQKEAKALQKANAQPQADNTPLLVSTAGIADAGSICLTKDKASYSQILGRINTAISTRNYAGLDTLFTKDGLDMFRRLVQYGNARIVDDKNCKYYDFRGNVVARSVKMSFSFSHGVQKSFVEDLVYTFNKDRKIECIAFGLNKEAFEDVAGNTFWNETTRMAIIEFLENYKTAYSLKRLDYLRSIFDDNAVIIVGHVARKADSKMQDDNNFNIGDNKVVSRTRYTKDQYMKSLANCFASNEFVNIRFAGNEILKYNAGGETYGIQIKQDYYSTTYGDSGYLFLMVDLNDPEMPVIKVRTWQENNVPTKDLVSVYDF